jgi:hypothetical protein
MVKAEKMPLWGKHSNLFAAIILIVSSSIFLAWVLYMLQENLSDPELDLFSGDSVHYVEMAESFARGEFLTHYVSIQAHRQPLYPALLSLVFLVKGFEPTPVFELALVNVVLSLLTIGVLFYFGISTFKNAWAGLAMSLLYMSSKFVVESVTFYYLTEVTFTLFSVLSLMFLAQYILSQKRYLLYISYATLGLSYLTRPNGLFLSLAVTVSLGTVIVFKSISPNVLRKYDNSNKEQSGILQQLLPIVFSILLFIVVTIPSWLPRVIVWQNPIYHGYLPNYMWVDSYEVGHVGGPPIYGPDDYFSTHNLVDVGKRIAYGVFHSYCFVPIVYVLEAYPLAIAGFVLALIRREELWCIIGLTMVLAMAPLVWTALSNPSYRVHFGGLFPFYLVFAGVLFDSITNGIR